MTSGRFPLAMLIDRAVFFDDSGNRVPAVQLDGPSTAGPVPWQRAGLEPNHLHPLAAQVRIEHHGRFGVGHIGPTFQRRIVGVDHATQQRAYVERLLAFGVVRRVEDLAERAEVESAGVR